jgi:hypothetical protein
MACKHCGLLKDEEAKLSRALQEAGRAVRDKADSVFVQHDMAAIKTVNIPVLRGFCKISALCDLIAMHGGFIAGGYARFCCSPVGLPANDIDVYPPNSDAARRIAADLDEVGFKKIHESRFSVSMRHPKAKKLLARPDTARWAIHKTIQIIKPEAMSEAHGIDPSSRDDVIRSFDMPIVRVALLDCRTALADERFWNDEKEFSARFEGMRSIGQLAARVSKYGSRGYRVSYSPEMEKTLKQIRPRFNKELSAFNEYAKQSFGDSGKWEGDEVEHPSAEPSEIEKCAKESFDSDSGCF